MPLFVFPDPGGTPGQGPRTTLYVGAPAGLGGITVDQAVNSVTVPAFAYPTLQVATMNNFQVITVATDSFDSDLRIAVAGNTPGVVVRARQYGNGSVGSVTSFRLVPANTSMVWQTVMYRSNGSGTASSVADGTLNRLEVLVQASQ